MSISVLNYCYQPYLSTL